MSEVSNDTILAEKVLLNFPDSLLPYVTPEQREELIHMFKESKSDTAKVAHALGSYAKLLVFKENWIRLQVTDVTMIEVAISRQLDKMLVIHTNKAPEPESTFKLYSLDWNYLGSPRLELNTEYFLADSLLSSERQNTINNIEFTMCSVVINEVDDTEVSLSACLSLPTLSEEEKKEIKGKFVQRNVNFNYKTFKKG